MQEPTIQWTFKCSLWISCAGYSCTVIAIGNNQSFGQECSGEIGIMQLLLRSAKTQNTEPDNLLPDLRYKQKPIAPTIVIINRCHTDHYICNQSNYMRSARILQCCKITPPDIIPKTTERLRRLVFQVTPILPFCSADPYIPHK